MTDFNVKKMTYRQYLFTQALMLGADIWTAKEAVATTAIEHPEWDMEEIKTFEEWTNND